MLYRELPSSFGIAGPTNRFIKDRGRTCFPVPVHRTTHPHAHALAT